MHLSIQKGPTLCPQTELAMRGSNGLGKGALRGGRRQWRTVLIRKNAYLVTLALVSPRRNRRSRAQTSIFTIENHHFLVQMTPWASWPPDVSAESLEARIPQPGVLSQASSARNPQPGVLSKIPQPGVLSQESSARIPQPGVLSKDSSARIPQPGVSSQSVWGPRWSHQYL